MFAATQASLESVANSKATGSQESLYPGALAIGTNLTTADDPATVCTTSGSPKDTEASTDEGRAKHVAKVAYCDLAMRPDGPDTTRGGIDRIQGFLCATKDQLTYDGVKKEFSLSFTTPCFSQTFADMVKSQNGNSSTSPAEVTSFSSVSAKDGNAAYSKLIVILVPAFELKYTIQLKQTDTMIAASAVLEEPGESSMGDALAIRLDTGDAGSIRYEGRFGAFRDSDQLKARHLRVIAKGKVNAASGIFSEVSSLNYLFQDIYSENGSKVQTVIGSPAAGYRATYQYGTNYLSFGTFASSPATLCYGGGTCSGNAGLKIATEEDLKFGRALIKNDSVAKDSVTWFKAHGPMVFETVSFAAEQD